MNATTTNPCDDTDDGVVVNGLKYYDRAAAPAPPDPDSLKAVLKAFTTEVASEHCEREAVAEHWKMVKALADDVERSGLGHLVVKGGLALHVALIDMFAEFKRRAKDRAALDAAEAYMLQTYASTSDLDTGIVLRDPDHHLQTVVNMTIRSIKNLRNTWPGLYAVHEGIVRQCNTRAAELASSKIATVSFAVDEQPDQRVYLATHADDPACQKECVVVESTAEKAVYLSNNESLVFLKGTNVADFYLVRAKWSIKAKVALRSGHTCEVACPAEMIDVAIPRTGDSRWTMAAAMGTEHYRREYEPVPGVSLPMVSLKYQLIDLQEMIREYLNGGNDPKIAKRAHRFVILSFLNNLLRYLDAEDDVDREAYVEFLKPRPSWYELVQTKVGWYHENSPAARELADFLDGVDGVLHGRVDGELIRHLVAVRDEVVRQKSPVPRSYFSGVGGASSGARWLPAMVLGAVTIAAALLGSA